MSTESGTEYEPSYRERTIDKKLRNHESRITKNERRWLITKGALAMMAGIKGVDFGITVLSSLI